MGLIILRSIKYFFIILCSVYVSAKLFHIKLRLIRFILIIGICSVSAVLTGYFRARIEWFSIPFMILAVFFVTKVLFCLDTNACAVCTLIALCISYGLYIVSTGVSVAFRLCESALFDHCIPEIIYIVFTGFLQSTATYFTLNVRRIRNGIAQILNKGIRNGSIYIGILVLLTVSYFGAKKSFKSIYIVPIAFCLLCVLMLYIIWKNEITHRYLMENKDRDIRRLQIAVTKQTELAETIQQHNDTLSQIVHKDNKLIPAMELAVRELLMLAASHPSDIVFQERAFALQKQLSQVSAHRAGIVKDYELQHKQLPPTNIPSVDLLLRYLLIKAARCQVKLDVVIIGDISNILTPQIPSEDLKTLIADIVENAIVAASTVTSKQVLVRLANQDAIAVIDVFDSGEPFSQEVLKSLGSNRITTHADTGGSGIGMMTVFSLQNKYGFSLEIEELKQSHSYTKRVSILFNGLSKHPIDSSVCQESLL